MKLDPKASGNALAIVGGVLYLVCAVWVLSARNSYMGVMNSWMHGFDFQTLPVKTLDFGTLIVGLVTFVLTAWIVGYGFALVYNRLARTQH